MDPRASELIRLLELNPHPEGGYFSEIFRSSHTVAPAGGEKRSAVTEIYFLLTADGISRWHRVASDEVWHYYEGAALELFWIEPGDEKCNRCLVGKVEKTGRPVAVVPAGCWQAARTTGAYTLAGCTVAPGFEFTDFRMLKDDPETAQAIKARFPGLSTLI
ncbi:MAG: cupin domain-containing protein [Thermodesulfobacteriota bacterium]